MFQSYDIANCLQINALTYDWLSDNIYWTNGKEIFQTTLSDNETTYTRTVVPNNTGLIDVQDLIVHPIRGYVLSRI